MPKGNEPIVADSYITIEGDIEDIIKFVKECTVKNAKDDKH